MSQSYDELIVDQDKARDLIAGSYVTADHPIQAWEKGRKFIASTLTYNGTILDIGCANGFFLKSLQTWSRYSLVPYGIDPNVGDIVQAKSLFPEYTSHFLPISLESFLTKHPAEFPELFDFIYWAVWVNFTVTADIIDLLLERIAPNGRLIFGFYPDSSEEPSDIRNNISVIEGSGYTSTILQNSLYPERNEKIVFIQRQVDKIILL